MKAWRWLLLSLLLILLVALAWRELSRDPGYVQIIWRGYSIESSLVIGVGLIVGAWLALKLLIGALLFPFRALSRRSRRVARRRLAEGVLAAHHGQHARAQRLLRKAASNEYVQTAALVTAVVAADACDDQAGAEALLTELDAHDPTEATLLRGRRWLAAGDAQATLSAVDGLPLPLLPAAMRLKIEALLDLGRAREAQGLVPELRRSKSLPEVVIVELEAKVASALLAVVDSRENLRTELANLPKSLRQRPEVVLAYARTAQRLGQAELADEAIEANLSRQWTEALVAIYGLAGSLPHTARLKRAEGWLAQHADSPALHVTLGRLCREDGLWGKAEAYLQSALQFDARADAWEELAATLAAQGEEPRARRALQNTLRVQRGEAATPLPNRPRVAATAPQPVLESRSSMGVPMLSVDSSPEP
jgi:HemY protein